ncbi:MAG: BMP family ABC transporter substrate-binding protein [Rickettsiales bacterium]
MSLVPSVYIPNVFKRACFLFVLSFSYALPAAAIEKFTPAIIYESSTSDSDKGFIESMKRGAQKAKNELGIDYIEYRIGEDEDHADAIEKVAESGATNIIAVGFQNVLPVMKLANKHADIKFTVIDGMVPPVFQNVQSVIFKDQEGAFLVGIIAGSLATSNKIGFIGGMDVPLINNFALGFFQGARYANKKVELFRDYVGKDQNDQTAWSNPERAKMLAKKQFNSGASIVFAAAGGSSVGVLEAAEEMGKYAIGVDINQNGLFPGTVVTSMVKSVDKVVYDTLVDAFSGRWEPGIKYLGIKENALDYAVDRNNKDLVTRNIIDKVEDAKDRIVRGLIKVETEQAY